MTRLHVVKVLILCFLARTALIISEDEEIFRAKKFMEFGVDIDFIDALPDRDGMARAVKAILDYPNSANIIEGGKPENMPAADLGALGFCIVQGNGGPCCREGAAGTSTGRGRVPAMRA